MANNLTSNPWIVDTPGASLLFAPDITVEHFEFVQYAADADNVIVQDRFGKNVWANNGTADLTEVRSGKVGRIHGLSVPTLSSGVLRIYIV